MLRFALSSSSSDSYSKSWYSSRILTIGVIKWTDFLPFLIDTFFFVSFSSLANFSAFFAKSFSYLSLAGISVYDLLSLSLGVLSLSFAFGFLVGCSFLSLAFGFLVRCSFLSFAFRFLVQRWNSCFRTWMGLVRPRFFPWLAGFLVRLSFLFWANCELISGQFHKVSLSRLSSLANPLGSCSSWSRDLVILIKMSYIGSLTRIFSWFSCWIDWCHSKLWLLLLA